MKDIQEYHKLWFTRNRLEFAIAHNGGLNNWDWVIFHGKLVNRYQDEELIRFSITQHIAPSLVGLETAKICDVACGSGYASYVSASQLQEINGCQVKLTGVDNFRDDFWLYKPKLYITVEEADLRRLRFEENAFDAAIFRFGLPFIPRDDQPAVLGELHRALKPGGVLVVMHDGAFTESASHKAFMPLFSESIRTSALKNMHYLSCESLVGMARRTGFEIAYAQDLTNLAFSYYSPPIANLIINHELSWQERKRERQRMKGLFEDWKRQDPISFEPPVLRPKSLRVARELYLCVLRK